MESVLPARVCHSRAAEPEVAIAAVGICPGVMHRGMHGEVMSSGSRSNKREGMLRSWAATALSAP